jgi:hypothetical protein
MHMLRMNDFFTKRVGKNEYLNEMKYFNPWISNTGLITWVPEVRIHTKCVIKVSDFPFDTQCCEINFYSWAHTTKQMIVKQFGNKNYTNITHLSQNTEWQVTEANISNTSFWIYLDLIKKKNIFACLDFSYMCFEQNYDNQRRLVITKNQKQNFSYF